ncbi:unnamed protein product [Paramecium octaurelia]|uniref:Ubiquitin-like domain-containing protein n=1 Tax=Paramecium octaurelia TaxID=43137 RepID=A0A8S1WIW3_PAROT|nr:unnamed protein product [Paramecium octaurelia]
MEIELEIEIFDANCKTTLSIDDTVSLNELIEFIQTQHPYKLTGVEMNCIQIQVGGTGQVINPSNNTLQQVLGGQKKAKLYIQRKQQFANSNSFQEYPSGNQNRPQQRNQIDQTNSQAKNQPQVFTTLPQQQQQQQYVHNTQQSQQFNLIVKNGQQQIQIQVYDSITIQDLIEASQQSLGVDPRNYHLYHGVTNLSLMNPQTTLKYLGLQYLTQMDWKMISQVNQFQTNQQNNYNQRPVQQPNMINQSHFQGQNLGGQTQYNPPQNQQQNQFQYQQQNQQNNFQQTNMAYQQQQQHLQTYQQQPQSQQQNQQGQIGQSQVNNPQGNPSQQVVQIPDKQITIHFEIQDGQIVRQFSTITTTNNTLLQIQDAVYQYLGISKDAASVDLFVGETPLGGGKLPLTLKMLQLTKEFQTFKVKVRWVGG